MKITIVTHGIPNSHSEQANNDPLLFLNFFEKKKIKFDLISIWDYDYNTSNKGKKYQEKFIKNKFKHLQYFKVLNFRKDLFARITRFFLRILSSDSRYFYGDKNIHREVLKLVKKRNSKIILNFFELPASIFANEKNINIFNYLGVARRNSEILRVKNLLKKFNLLSLIKALNAAIYIWKMNTIYEKFLSNAKLNLFAAVDSYNLFKKKYKNAHFSGPLSNVRIEKKKKKKKVPIILMIGALNSNFMQDSLSMVANSAIKLNEIYKKKKFKLRIVGKSKPPINIKKKLNFPWVEFIGWVKDSEKEYQNASFLFCPNSISAGPRTKLLESASSKVCIITTKENIKYFFPHFHHNKDMIIAKNMSQFCNGFEKVLLNKKLKMKMVNSAKKKYIKYHSPDNILSNNLYLIKKYSKIN